MYFAHTALAFACCAVLVKSGGEDNSAKSAEDASVLDNHTFVALIDILFTDNSKKTCTGAIIHDNVIITAAHCFKKSDKKVHPELTASFVVIGSKSMFDTGYEQYLPIERVLTHPKFKGWTADLCLVYTFAGMTSDKPGTIIPLAREHALKKHACNVTILSWGRVTDVEEEKREEKHEYYKNKKYQRTKAPLDYPDKKRKLRGRTSINSEEEIKMQKRIVKRLHFENTNSDQSDDEFAERLKIYVNEKGTTKLMSQYLTGSKGLTFENKESDFTSRWNITNVNKKYDKKLQRNSNKRHNERKQMRENFETVPPPAPEEFYESESLSPAKSPKTNIFKSYFQNWRRQMGTQQNKLTVENFNIINTKSCKSTVKKTMPSRYDISESKDVICYASKDRFINDDDSGALAISHGQLVAVIVGGTDTAGNRVAVGIKTLCYCSWISENLPNGGNLFTCCQNCCKKEETGD